MREAYRPCLQRGTTPVRAALTFPGMSVRAFRLACPGQLVEVRIPDPGVDDLADGEVLVRFLAGAICGSDLPGFLGRQKPLDPPVGTPGYPLHEVVGDVVATRGDIAVGTRVVGWSSQMAGLSEVFRAPCASLLPVTADRDPVRTVVVQPLCTVLHTLDRLPPVAGRHAAVIGQGPLGLLFSHALHDRGAARVTGVDRVDRSAVARAFGVDDPVWADSATWAAGLADRDRPDLVIEAVGHQTGTLDDAVEALAHRGTVFGFGVPDSAAYPLAYERFFRKGATLVAGVTEERRAALALAARYLDRHPDLPDAYLTHVLPFGAAQEAFTLAAVPAAGRLKVALVADRPDA